jgi:thymidylate synthase
MGNMTLQIGRIIRANTISDAWYRGINMIWNQGHEVTDERGSRIKEYLNLMIVIKDPYTNRIPADISWNEQRLEEYAKQIITG